MPSENTFLTSITITRNDLVSFENAVRLALLSSEASVILEDKMFVFNSNNTTYGIKVLNDWAGLALYRNGELLGSSLTIGEKPDTFYYISGLNGSGAIGLGYSVTNDNNMIGPQLTHGWDSCFAVKDNTNIKKIFFSEPVLHDGFHHVLNNSTGEIETFSLHTDLIKTNDCSTIVNLYIPDSLTSSDTGGYIANDLYLSYNFQNTNVPSVFIISTDNNGTRYVNMGNQYANASQQKFILKVTSQTL